MALMMTCFGAMAQGDKISRKMNPGDGFDVTVKFEGKVSKDEAATQARVNAMLSSSEQTTRQLSINLDKLTNALERKIAQDTLTKADIVEKQMGISASDLNRTFKRNGVITLIACIPGLIIIFASLLKFLDQKGLEVKQLITASSVLILYGAVGSVILYAVLSFIFNKQYFIIKGLMSALF